MRLPWVEVDYKKLESILLDPILSRFSDLEVLACIFNRAEINSIIEVHGHIFYGPDGKERAARRIAETWRSFKLRKLHLHMVRKLHAGKVFRFYWLRKKKRQALDRLSNERFFKTLIKTSALIEKMKSEWNDKYRDKSRFIIHIPSLSYDISQRQKMPYYDLFQRDQLGRMMDLRDPNISLVCVLPAFDDEFKNHMEERLASYFQDFQGLISSGRLNIIIPESTAIFNKRSSLTAQLLESPSALQSIRNITQGAAVYILPSILSKNEIILSALLEIPILAIDYSNISLLTSKSAARLFIKSCSVDLPYGIEYIKTKGQLMQALLFLFSNHRNHQAFVFKIDGCKTFAYWTPKNQDVFQTDREIIFAKIITEAKIIHGDINLGMARFFKSMFTAGGVVEVAPPSIVFDSNEQKFGFKKSTKVHACIFPNGEFQLYGTSDTIFGSPFESIGSFAPQQSCQNELLLSISSSIFQKCFQTGIFGIVTIEFVTWVENDQQRIWCTGIKPYYSRSLSETQAIVMRSASRVVQTHESQELVPGVIVFDENTTRKLKLWYMNKSEFTNYDRIKEKTGLDYFEKLPEDPVQRIGFTSHRFSHTGTAGMSHATLYSLLVDSKFVFDESKKLGTCFMNLNDRRNYDFFMMVISKDLKACIQQLFQCMLILQRRLYSRDGKKMTSNFKNIAESVLKAYPHPSLPSEQILGPFKKIHENALSLEELTHEYVAIPDYEALELDSFISIKPDTSISRKNQPILPLLKISKESLEVIQAEVPSFALPRAYPDFNNIGGLVKESKSILVNHWNDPLRIPVGTDAPHFVKIMEERVMSDLEAEREKKAREEEEIKRLQREAEFQRRMEEERQWKEMIGDFDAERKRCAEAGITLTQKVQNELVAQAERERTIKQEEMKKEQEMGGEVINHPVEPPQVLVEPIIKICDFMGRHQRTTVGLKYKSIILSKRAKKTQARSDAFKLIGNHFLGLGD